MYLRIDLRVLRTLAVRGATTRARLASSADQPALMRSPCTEAAPALLMPALLLRCCCDACPAAGCPAAALLLPCALLPAAAAAAALLPAAAGCYAAAAMPPIRAARRRAHQPAAARQRSAARASRRGTRLVVEPVVAQGPVSAGQAIVCPEHWPVNWSRRCGH
jgi:hypothetical protein